MLTKSNEISVTVGFSASNHESEKENIPNTTATSQILNSKQLTEKEGPILNGAGEELTEESIKQNLARLKMRKMGAQSAKSKDSTAKSVTLLTVV